MALIPSIGIDLGSRYIRVAYMLNGRPEVAENDLGKRQTPNCLAFDGSREEKLFGELAEQQAALDPSNAVDDWKLTLGRKYEERHAERDSSIMLSSLSNINGRAGYKIEFGGE